MQTIPLDRTALETLIHAWHTSREAVIQALADPAPAEVVAVPVRVKKRLVAFVLCDDPGHPASHDHVDEIITACKKAGVALEVLILRKKLLS